MSKAPRSILVTFRAWAKEPLVHFVAIGVVLLGLYRAVAAPPPSRTIDVTPKIVAALREEHTRRTGAQPTPEETAALVQRYVDDEVLIREALALGLDRGDVVVRRRLIQKMRFIAESTNGAPEPTDGDLDAYLEAHADRVREPARVSLVHVFIGKDKHGEGGLALAAVLRERLLGGAGPASLGDSFAKGQTFTARSERELEAIFGSELSARAMALPAGEWSAPITSAYGWHLVRVSARTAAHAPELAGVRDGVRRELVEERRVTSSRSALDRIRRGYDIRGAGE